MKTIKIYLAGSIKKGSSDNHKKFYWTDREKQEIRDVFQGFEVVFLDPHIRGDKVDDPLSVMGRDFCQVTVCDFVFVDARERRGLGVGMEMAVAKMHGVPVVAIAPRNSHYRRDEITYVGQTVKDFVHSNVWGCSDAVVETPREAAEWARAHLENPKPVKGPEFVREAIEHYKRTNLHRDGLMKKVLE
ncbi:MAG: hypothetical protein ACE5FW_01370 [Candidatus Aenigmatarchaeota archaeon]